MKKIWNYVLIGIVVAIGGMFVSDAAGHFFNGLGDYGFGCILGICMYLCSWRTAIDWGKTPEGTRTVPHWSSDWTGKSTRWAAWRRRPG